MRMAKRAAAVAVGVLITFVLHANGALADGIFGKKSLGDLVSGKGATEMLSGAAGAAAGVLLADSLAKSDGKRLHLSKDEIAKRKRGYAISLGLAGLAVGGALGGTVYDKLSEQGRKAREKALIDAASNARPQHYSEPTAPSIAGVATPGTPYAVTASNQECVDVEDNLAQSGSAGDSIFVKMCRSVPNGNWAQVTA